MNKYLIKLANHLDKKGLHKEADYVDWILRKRAEEMFEGFVETDAQKLAQALNYLMDSEKIEASDFSNATTRTSAFDRTSTPEEFGLFNQAYSRVSLKIDLPDGITLDSYMKNGLKCIKIAITKMFGEKTVKYRFEVCAKASLQENDMQEYTMSFSRLLDIVEETKGSGF